jgi:hypothetical protein
MSRVVLIASAAYLSPEFIAEFGLLPPAFLPLGNRRVFEHQRELFADTNTPLFLSIPEGFQPAQEDRVRLEDLGFSLVPVPVGLTLGESILYVINDIAMFDCEFCLLHGDTLIKDLPLAETDVFSVGETNEFYPWAEYDVRPTGEIVLHEGLFTSKERPVVSGYFCFSSSALLVQSLTRARGNFIEGLNRYAAARPIRPTVTGPWYDLGHLHTYFWSRARMTNERAFNSLSATDRTIRKWSLKKDKIEAEISWFENIPSQVRSFTPHLVRSWDKDDGKAYEVEYLYLATLSDLFVFCTLPSFVWERIFEACNDFLSTCARFRAPPGAADHAALLYLPKTLARLEAFAQGSGIDPYRPWRYDGRPLPSLNQIAELAAARVSPPSAEVLCVVHGDFCFSNIFYDFRANTIKVADPRGEHGIFGDIRYDIAKLCHSVIGGYDFIVTDRYVCRFDGNYSASLQLPESAVVRDVQRVFEKMPLAGCRPSQAAAPAIMILLFLSMLPLHSDRPERQRAFVANALRLFQMLEDAG